MVTFFLKGVKEEALDAGKRAIKLIDLQKKWERQIRDHSTNVSGMALKIVDSLFDLPITNPFHVQNKFGGTHATASRALKLLESLGILKEEANP